jgi:hypothetical protein
MWSGGLNEAATNIFVLAARAMRESVRTKSGERRGGANYYQRITVAFIGEYQVNRFTFRMFSSIDSDLADVASATERRFA